MRPKKISYFLIAGTAAMAIACGKPSRFASKGSEPEVTPAPTSVPETRRAPVKGFEDPELRGSATQNIGGPAVLGAPVDPSESQVVTKIEGGTPTNIESVKSLVTDKTTPVACPGGIVIGNCIPGVPVFRWAPAATADDARTLVSSCKGVPSSFCDPLHARAAALGIQYSGRTAFVALQEPEAGNTQLRSIMSSITICHGSLDSPNPGGEYLLSQGLSCVKYSETFWGFRERQATPSTATVPLYQWNSGPSVVLSLDKSLPPAPGFQLNSVTPILYVLPPG